jgi:beta-N-acetylhexosaminidase
VNLNLAPVADVVPPAHPTTNQPIGRYYREYGYTPGVVGSHAVAFLTGMRDAHVATAAKHFPGLGRATGNTDVVAGVTDPTTRGDAYLQPFQQAVTAGTAFVMVSSARYPAIDRGRLAVLSPTVIGTVLRGNLGFTGVVISDDLANAKAVASLSPATRALRFFIAGGDMLLTVSTTPVAAMVNAVLTRMRTYASFTRQVNAAVLKVLEAKAAAGLVR